MEYSDTEHCPIRRFFRVLGSKWIFLILIELEQPKRYGELKKAIPDVSEKMLIEKLRVLERYGFILRKNYNQIPPKVEYSLTKSGQEALIIVPLLVGIGKSIPEDADDMSEIEHQPVT